MTVALDGERWHVAPSADAGVGSGIGVSGPVTGRNVLMDGPAREPGEDAWVDDGVTQRHEREDLEGGVRVRRRTGYGADEGGDGALEERCEEEFDEGDLVSEEEIARGEGGERGLDPGEDRFEGGAGAFPQIVPGQIPRPRRKELPL